MATRRESHFDPELELRRYEVLLRVADLIVRHDRLPDLFREINLRLQEVVPVEFLNFALHDSSRNVMRLHLWEGVIPQSTGIEVRVDQAVSGWVLENQSPLILDDITIETRFEPVLQLLREKGVRTYCVFPLTTSQRKLGALGVGSMVAGAFDRQDVRLLERTAAMAALVIDGAMVRQSLEEKTTHLETLVEASRMLVSSLDVKTLFPSVAEKIGRVVKHEFAGLAMFDPEQRGMRAHVLASSVGNEMIMPGETIPLDQSLAKHAFLSQKTKTFTRSELQSLNSGFADRVVNAGIQSMCCVPLVTAKGVLGTMNVGRNVDAPFSETEQFLLEQVAAQLAVAIENARAFQQIEELKDRLYGEKLYLENEIDSATNFGEIAGDSAALRGPLENVRTVATTDATVILLGESGTGKELFARALHRMSLRREKSLIKLNCAAIPTGLLESELFGHERGAFTGAITQKIGRLEMADGGTLFLDECGDIPLELQPKLLRVLQDKEFERLGSNRTIHVNVRLVAATNRDLEQCVAEGTFRRDLYYRLNVFPIRLPALRERRDDIPILTRHFIKKSADRLDKKIESIPAATMEALVRWNWPGNVRELENFIERSVILSKGNVLHAPVAELRLIDEELTSSLSPLEIVERAHIVQVLRETRGLIGGEDGAAARLNMKRTTLQSRIQKLRISSKDY